MGLFNKNDKQQTKGILPIYVLLKIAPSYERVVYRELEKLQEITECYPIFGEYDLIIQFWVEAPYNEIGISDFVVNKLRTIEGIIETNTISQIRV